MELSLVHSYEHNRFILTMWYVNEFAKQGFLEEYKFYINYVICKFEQVLYFETSPVLGFILTMWYVNVDSSPPASNSFAGFILTMWYVNIKKSTNKNLWSFVLY